MSFTRVDLETGYILHTRPYRETSLLLDIFTRHYGRISTVARGARKLSAKNRHPSLQLFTRYYFSWRGKTQLYNLIQYEQIRQGESLLLPYQLCCGLYLNELLMRILQYEDPHENIYTAYQTALTNLQTMPIQIALRLFEKQLLQAIGYGFSLENICPELFYCFEIAEGFKQTQPHIPNSFSGESLLALSNHTLEAKHLPEIKRLMRSALSPLIGKKPLKSRELFI